jgi:thymidylate kinase
MKEIAISGIDGSGKSTIASRIMALQRRRGLRVRVIWFRWRALTLYVLYAYSRLRRLYVKFYHPIAKRWFLVHVFRLDPVTALLYPYLLFLDLAIHYIFNRISLLVLGVEVVIYDRFFLDALVDSLYESRRCSKRLLRLYLSMHSKSSRSVVLDVDIKTAVERKKDIVSLKELEFKRKLYLLLAKYLNIPVVNARKSVDDVVQEVCEKLGLGIVKTSHDIEHFKA